MTCELAMADHIMEDSVLIWISLLSGYALMVGLGNIQVISVEFMLPFELF